MRGARFSAGTADLYGLPGGYRSLRLGPEEGVEVEVVEQPDVRAELAEALDSQLAAFADVEKRGYAWFSFAARTFDGDDCVTLLDALGILDELKRQRPQAKCVVHVILLMQSLFADDESPSDAESRTQKNVAKLDAYFSDCGSASFTRMRVWLIDGRSREGQNFDIGGMQDMLDVLDPEILDDSLGLPRNYYGLGGRTLVFPRQRILDYLGTMYAGQILSRESDWIDGGTVPFATVANECADFIERDVADISRMMEQDENSNPIVAIPNAPSVAPEEPLAAIMSRLQGEAAELTSAKGELGRVQAKLARNAAEMAKALNEALDGRVEKYLDQDSSRIIMAEAFLDMLRGSSSPLIVGDQIDTGRKRRLRDAFVQAVDFFDSVTGFDPAKRVALSEQREQVVGERQHLANMAQELVRDTERLAAEEDGAEGDVKALEDEIAEAAKRIEDLEQSILTGEVEVKRQDIVVQGAVAKGAIAKDMMSDVEERIASAAETLVSVKAAVDKAYDGLLAAESVLKEAVAQMVIRVIIALLGLLLVGLVGVLALPFLFGAVPVVGGPLFGLVGTVVGATFLRWWGLAMLVALVVLVIAQFRRYLSLNSKVDALRTAYEAAKSAFGSALRDYWDALLQRFLKQCDWIRHTHVFNTERGVLQRLDSQRKRLESFRAELVRYRDQAAAEVARFQLGEWPTELVVVDKSYVTDLVNRKRKTAEQLSRGFFDLVPKVRHPFSRYFTAEDNPSDGVELFRVEARDECLREVFDEVNDMTVQKAIEQDETEPVRRAISSSDCFLQINIEADLDEVVIAIGKDPGFLAARMGNMPKKPVLLKNDSDEKVLVLRLVEGVDLAQVKGLQQQPKS